MPTDAAHLWLVLWRAYESVRAHALRHIESLGIGFADFAVLEVLLHKGPTPVNEIGARIGLTSASITAAVDRLERKGLVSRRSDPADRRARVVHLTASGKRLIGKAFAEHQAALEGAVSGLDAAEQEQTVKLLKKLGLRAQARLAEESK